MARGVMRRRASMYYGLGYLAPQTDAAASSSATQNSRALLKC